MGKISPVSAKYIVHTTIDIEGVVDRPDVIGAIFGQTEGLLGSDLELRELQRSGRIGRIEVDVETKNGKTKGNIIIPSSLDKAETSIIAAALEIIQRIGPCNAKIKVENIEDVRISKRNFVIERAKELLKGLMDNVLPDSQELTDEVAYSVRIMECQEYGRERLPAGPAIDESDEVIVVEGRADVLNLLKHGIKNSIAINGTNIPQTIMELSRKKIVTVFVDGDRGGDLIIKEILEVGEIDYVTKAPDGKEVEEITKKEIHKALRSRMTAEQAKLEIGARKDLDQERSRRPTISNGNRDQRRDFQQKRDFRPPEQRDRPQPPVQRPRITDEEKAKFKEMLEGLIGTRGAFVLDDKLNILGKVPITELQSTLKSLNRGIYAVVMDGNIDKNLLQMAERSQVKFLVAMDAKVKPTGPHITIVTGANL
ncbi:DNA primase [Candidatus Woesearchaeota archaeon]|nr:DNA primase [Candidatus Woesearchaeota archaeon]